MKFLFWRSYPSNIPLSSMKTTKEKGQSFHLNLPDLLLNQNFAKIGAVLFHQELPYTLSRLNLPITTGPPSAPAFIPAIFLICRMVITWDQSNY